VVSESLDQLSGLRRNKIWRPSWRTQSKQSRGSIGFAY
jgi:hypothetical protein